MVSCSRVFAVAIYNAAQTNNKRMANDPCPCCLEPLADDDAVTLLCGHALCRNCLLEHARAKLKSRIHDLQPITFMTETEVGAACRCPLCNDGGVVARTSELHPNGALVATFRCAGAVVAETAYVEATGLEVVSVSATPRHPAQISFARATPFAYTCLNKLMPDLNETPAQKALFGQSPAWQWPEAV
jgi:hypothetical protein